MTITGPTIMRGISAALIGIAFGAVAHGHSFIATAAMITALLLREWATEDDVR